MGTVKRWAIIENNKVVNVIIADEQFIIDSGLNAVEDNLATPGLDIDEQGNIIPLPVQFGNATPAPEIEEPESQTVVPEDPSI